MELKPSLGCSRGFQGLLKDFLTLTCTYRGTLNPSEFAIDPPGMDEGTLRDVPIQLPSFLPLTTFCFLSVLREASSYFLMGIQGRSPKYHSFMPVLSPGIHLSSVDNAKWGVPSILVECSVYEGFHSCRH